MRRPDQTLSLSRAARELVLAGASFALALTATRSARQFRALGRPVVVPVEDLTRTITAHGETHPAMLQLAHGDLLIPLENVGLTAALDVRVCLTLPSAGGRRAEAGLLAIGSAQTAALIVGQVGQLEPFDLDLSYRDAPAKWFSARFAWAGRTEGFSGHASSRSRSPRVVNRVRALVRS
jgi:hypothetical protein